MPGKPEITLPSLDEFISASRKQGFCTICTEAPADAKRQIRAKYDADVRPWAAFCRYLKACGVANPTPSKVQRHLEQGHPDE